MMKITTDQIEKNGEHCGPCFGQERFAVRNYRKLDGCGTARSSGSQHALCAPDGRRLAESRVAAVAVRLSRCRVMFPGPWLCSRMVAAEEADFGPRTNSAALPRLRLLRRFSNSSGPLAVSNLLISAVAILQVVAKRGG